MHGEPTTTEKLQGLPWSIATNAANSVFVQFTLLGWVFVLLLSQLGFNKTEIGFLLALFPLAGLVALVAGPRAARAGYKRTFLVFFGLRKLLAGFLLLIPMVRTRLGSEATLVFVAGVVAVFAVCRAIAESALYPWIQEYVPNSVRGKYSAADNIFTTLSGFLAVTVAGYVVGSSKDLGGFMVLVALGVLFGLGAVWTASHIPGGAPRAATPRGSAAGMLAAVREDRNFRRYLLGAGLVTATTVPLTAFLALFMREQVGLSPASVVLAQAATLMGTLASSYLWGWAADRYGSKPVMLVGVYLTLVLSVSWMSMPRHTAWSLRIAFGVAFLQGVANIGWLIGSTRMLFVNVVPHQKSTPYMAVYYAWIGVSGGLSQLAAGSLLDHSRQIDGRFLFLNLDPYTPLFAAGTILPLASILLFREVRDEGRMSVGQFAGLFLRGNPFLALESSVRFYLARDERTTVSVTERLAQARSPLNVDELLEALSDPRFNVRFEAIVSIARVRSDPRLIEALSRVLEGSDPALGVVAAWALGRIGDPAGIEPLRRGLDSSYRSIQVHCARALGSLGDVSVGPLLLGRLTREKERGLCMAYASALGKFRTEGAVARILELLHATEETASRMELSLAVARIIGDEGNFIRLVRPARTALGTVTAQALGALAKGFDGDRPDAERRLAAAQTCAAAFARGDLEAGAGLLRGLIEAIPRNEPEGAVAQVLDECGRRLGEIGPARPEYILLALFTLDQA